jgi:S-layer protein (TIGR01567 family)
MVAPIASAERITEEVEIRGTVVNNSTMYDYTSFAGFWYDLDNDLSSENMTVNVTVGTRTIEEGNLVYRCTPEDMLYKNPALNNELGGYKLVGFMADEYIAYDNKTDKLVKLLIEWDSGDDKVLKIGEMLEMPDGYVLVAKEIDLDGGKCVLALYKDGFGLDTEIVQDGATYTYLDDEDVMIFSVKIDSVFRGTDTNMVIVKYVFLMSEDILKVGAGDNFGVMEVTSTSGGITLKNDDTVTLNKGDEVEIMGDLYFKVADSDDLRYYIAKVVSLKCEDCPTCPEVPVCPEPEPCEPEIVKVEVINETIKYVNVPAEPIKNVPGMEAVFAIAGLLTVVWLIERKRDD